MPFFQSIFKNILLRFENSKSQLHLLLLHSLIKIANILQFPLNAYHSFLLLHHLLLLTACLEVSIPQYLLKIFAQNCLDSVDIFLRVFTINAFFLFVCLPFCLQNDNNNDDDDKREENNIKCANKTQHKGKLVEGNFQNSSAAARQQQSSLLVPLVVNIVGSIVSICINFYFCAFFNLIIQLPSLYLLLLSPLMPAFALYICTTAAAAASELHEYSLSGCYV